MRVSLTCALIVCSTTVVIAAGGVQRSPKTRLGTGDSIPVRVSDPVPVNDPAFDWTEAAAQREQYRGITVTLRPEAGGIDRLFQQEVAEALQRLDFVPDRRVEHFQELLRLPIVLTGWDGTIEESAAIPGGLLVCLKVVPRNTGGMASVNDYVMESYLYSQGRLEYLGLDRPELPGVITFN